jgi:hypothetical protein
MNCQVISLAQHATEGPAHPGAIHFTKLLISSNWSVLAAKSSPPRFRSKTQFLRSNYVSPEYKLQIPEPSQRFPIRHLSTDKFSDHIGEVQRGRFDMYQKS